MRRRYRLLILRVFSNKNISPNTLALWVGLGVGFLSGCWVAFLTRSGFDSIGSFLVTGASTYLTLYYALQYFIYRKIKLIFKFISQTKASRREEYFNQELLPRKTMEQVQEEVERWAEEYKGEMERLQSNEQFRREFLMNLAHELKTPLFSAQGYIETLLSGALKDEQVNELFLQKASRSIDRLSDLVKDLDVISRIESNRLLIEPTYFIIQDLIHEVFDELEEKARRKKISLFIKKGCEQPIQVYADRSRIKQVLINLVENSIQYGKETGETSAGIYTVDAEDVYVEITDTGIGIQEDQVPRVFERFFRTDSARSRYEGGTGLGLAIVKHIIEAHHHTVTCRSRVDVGTSFGFTLDRVEKHRESKS